MTIDELYGLVPETRREEAKAAIAEMSKGYVKIDGPDIARKVMGENEYLKSILESETSKRVDNHDAKFRAEKLPGIVAEEIKKLGPKPKDPELAAALERVEKLEKENAEKEARATREAQRARAVAVLSEKKIPAALADRFIGANDDETDANLKGLVELLDGWKTETVNAEVMGRLGGNPPPVRGGEPVKPKDLEAQYEEALAKGDADLVLALQGKLQTIRKK
jgi:crotonobetainyl-CoA:carnitine CoA-transferase CaiB-like acyl-CoA transferase